MNDDLKAKQSRIDLDAVTRPGDADSWLSLSEDCHNAADYEGAISAARQAVSIAPRMASALRRMADSLMHSGYGLHEAHEWYLRLLEVAPGDPQALAILYYFHLTRENYVQAVQCATAADEAHPGNPEAVLKIARAMRLSGDEAGAKRQLERAESLCGPADEALPPDPFAALKPLLRRLRGDYEQSEALSEQLCRNDGLWLTHGQYPDDGIDRIARLRRRVAGRDIFLFGFGPSLQEIVEKKSLIAKHDFVAMTLTTFPVIEESVLRDFGRRIDVVCITHPRPLDQLASHLRERCKVEPRLQLALPLWLRETAIAMGNGDLVDDTLADIVWFDTRNELPPIASRPLDFPGINTLSCALCIALLSMPRRIFLFGFDGGIRGSDAQQAGSLYFKESDKRYHAPARDVAGGREETMAYLWWDSLRVNETAAVTMRHISLLFDVPLPPIYNVCPGSLLEPFPRISMAEFAEIILSPGSSGQ